MARANPGPPLLVHNTSFMPLRLPFAFALSLVLHGVLFLPDLLPRPTPRPRPALDAVLRAPLPPPAAEPLLKDTLAEESDRAATKPAEPPPEKKASTNIQRSTRIAQRKLLQHVFYPPEAVARGIEGEVRLLVRLDADGRVSEARIAASSGHAILDDAALRAAYAAGRLGGEGVRELILPVVFHLQ